MAARKDIVMVLSFDDKGTATVKLVTAAVKKELDKAGKSAQKMGKDFNAMGKQVANSTQGMGRMKKMLKSTWAQMAMGMGVMTGVTGIIRMFTRAVRGIVKTGREFEETWANVTTMLSGPAYDAAEDMKNELMRMSPVLGGVTELAKGMYQVLSASIEPAKAIEFLGVAAMSAKAGVTDVFTAVDALTTIINAYGLATEDAMAVSDIMFMTVKRGKLTYESLAQSLGPVVAVSAQMGVKFKEVAAAMATLTRQGLMVRTTAVAIRAVLVAVMQGQEGAMETARKLRIEFSAQAIATKGLIPWLAELGEKTGGNAVILQKMFKNIRGLMAVLPLAGKAMKGVAGDLALMGEAAGSTTEALLKQMDSVSFWIDVFGNMMERLKAAIWKGLSEPLREGIKDAEDFQKRIEETSNEMIDFGEAFGETIGKAIRTLIEFRETIVAVGSTLAGMFVVGKMLKWITAIKFAAGGATASIGAMGTVSAGTALALKGLGVAALVAAAAFIGWKFGRWISDITGLSKACMQAKEYIKDMGDTVENSIVHQQNLRDAIKGTDMSVHELRDKYGTYKKALDAVIASEDPLIKKSLEAAVAAQLQAMAVKNLTDVIDELKLKTREDLIPIWDRLAIVFESTAEVLREKFTDKQLTKLAKQFIALSEELGLHVSPEVRALAGDFTFLEAKIEPVTGAMGKLRGMTKGELAPSFLSASTAGTTFWGSLKGIFEWMKKLADVTKGTGIVLREEAEKELAAKLEIYETLKTERERFADGTFEGEKRLIEVIIALYKKLGLKVDAELKKRLAAIGSTIQTSLGKFAEAFQKAMNKIQEYASIVLPRLNAIFNQFYQNQIQRIDNEYQARKEAIDASMMSDQEKYFAIEKLDREMEKRRLKALRRQAKATKMTALMEAIVNTASAVAEALPNIAKSIIIAGLGAIQIAAIAAQPLPSFAKGGIAWEPQLAMVGERGPEVIRPLEEDRRLVRGPGEMKSVNAEFNANFYIQSPDALGVRDFVRDKAGPEFIAWVKLNKTELLEAMDME